MHECPLCGETANRRGETFDSAEQVVAHVVGSHDDLHGGVTGPEVRDEIREVKESDRNENGPDTPSSQVSNSVEREAAEQQPSPTAPRTGGRQSRTTKAPPDKDSAPQMSADLQNYVYGGIAMGFLAGGFLLSKHLVNFFGHGNYQD